VIAVEWADRFPDTLPDDHIVVNLARSEDDPEAREVTIEATGPLAKRVLEAFGNESRRTERSE
jgi:tRNA A37 threonylcarbamoyladenosine biosynthesis protein TsaE